MWFKTTAEDGERATMSVSQRSNTALCTIYRLLVNSVAKKPGGTASQFHNFDVWGRFLTSSGRNGPAHSTSPMAWTYRSHRRLAYFEADLLRCDVNYVTWIVSVAPQRSCKVTDFDISRKNVHDFPLVITSNLAPFDRYGAFLLSHLMRSFEMSITVDCFLSADADFGPSARPARDCERDSREKETGEWRKHMLIFCFIFWTLVVNIGLLQIKCTYTKRRFEPDIEPFRIPELILLNKNLNPGAILQWILHRLVLTCVVLAQLRRATEWKTEWRTDMLTTADMLTVYKCRRSPVRVHKVGGPPPADTYQSSTCSWIC